MHRSGQLSCLDAWKKIMNRRIKMKSTKKTLSMILTAAIVLSMTACNSGESNNQGGSGDQNGDSTTTGSINTSFEEAYVPEIDENAETGVIKYLTYETNFDTANAEMITLFKERYGGDIDIQATATSLNYAEMLGTRIATGDSPDMVRYEGWAFPHGASFNMFTPLDTYINLNSELWAGMKNIADQYIYNGKHFYIPYMTDVNFAIVYNNRVLEENGMPDPIEYVKDGTWDWNKFEDMLKRWQDIDPVNHISYNGVGGLSFTYTTGKKIIDVVDGDILNNMRDPDIARCMQWLERLQREHLIGANPDQQAAGAPNGFVHPGEAFMDGNLLFLGMGAVWSYESAKESLDKANLPNEIKFIPFPKDPQADTWYQLTGNYGYLVPAGAQNVKGTIDWINLLRAEEIDPENVANEKAKLTSTAPEYYPICPNSDCNDTVNPDSKGRHTFTVEENEAGVSVCPNCGTERREKYKVVWTEEQYDMYQEMLTDGGKYTLVYDYVYGFGTTFKEMFNDHLLDQTVFGDYSFTSECESLYGSVESYLQPYRDRMAADARGEEVTTTPPEEA